MVQMVHKNKNFEIFHCKNYFPASKFFNTLKIWNKTYIFNQLVLML